MLAHPLLAALDNALECPQVAHLPRGDRLALALWWLIERVADEFEMPTEQAADEVAMLCGLAKGTMQQRVTFKLNECDSVRRKGRHN